MKFQLLHRAVKGTPVISLNTVTRVVHIWLLARQIHNTTFSPPPPPLAPLTFTALSLSQPCSSLAPTLPVWRRWRGRSYWRADVRLPNQPKDGWRRSVDIVLGHDDEPAASGHESTWIRPPPHRPSREQLLHSRQRLVLLEPPMPSLSSVSHPEISNSMMWIERIIK
jgi:hypothetical protein